jgi:hypothetical protein
MRPSPALRAPLLVAIALGSGAACSAISGLDGLEFVRGDATGAPTSSGGSGGASHAGGSGGRTSAGGASSSTTAAGGHGGATSAGGYPLHAPRPEDPCPRPPSSRPWQIEPPGRSA